MSSNVMHAPTRVWEGLLNESPRFEAYYYRHIQPKAGIMIRRLYPNDPIDWLEDCFSQAFLTLLNKIRSGNYEHRNLDAFALQIIKFTYSNARRKRLSLVPFTHEIPEKEIADSPLSNAGDLFDRFEQKKLSRWYQRLPIQQRFMLDLRMQGLDYEEIAKELDLAPGTVRNHFSKLLREARKISLIGAV